MVVQYVLQWKNLILVINIKILYAKKAATIMIIISHSECECVHFPSCMQKMILEL